MITVIYRIEDGEISGVAHGVVPRDMPGCGTITVSSSSINPDLHKVDLMTLTVVEKTDSEKAAAQLSKLAVEVQRAIVMQLNATDQYVLPDRGLTSDDLAAWIAYRKALRDLSKGSASVADMIGNFPVRPDAVDPAADLRARLLAATPQASAPNQAISAA